MPVAKSTVKSDCATRLVWMPLGKDGEMRYKAGTVEGEWSKDEGIRRGD
jgi:hypothetical protein